MRPSPFNDEYHDLLRTHSSEYALVSDFDDPRTKLPVSEMPGDVRTEMFWYDQLTLEGVIGRIRSVSYVAHGVADLPVFEELVRQAFERHATREGTLAWNMRTIALAWPRRT